MWCVEGTCPGAFRAPEHTPPRRHLKASFTFEFGIVSLAGWSLKLCDSILPIQGPDFDLDSSAGVLGELSLPILFCLTHS